MAVLFRCSPSALALTLGEWEREWGWSKWKWKKTQREGNSFKSEARWDVGVERVLVRVVDVGRFMEVGGMEGMDELGFEGWDNGHEGEESQDDG